MYVLRLKKKKSFFFSFALTHTQIITLKDYNSFSLSFFTMWHPFSFSYAAHSKKITYNHYSNNNPSRHTILVSHELLLKYKLERMRSSISNRSFSLHGSLATKSGWTHNTCAKHTGPLKQKANFNSITKLHTVKNLVYHFLHIVQ